MLLATRTRTRDAGWRDQKRPEGRFPQPVFLGRQTWAVPPRAPPLTWPPPPPAGESVEENANVVVRLLIRRPECFGPALRGEGGNGLLAAIEEAIQISQDPARDGPTVKKDRRRELCVRSGATLGAGRASMGRTLALASRMRPPLPFPPGFGGRTLQPSPSPAVAA